MNQNTYIHHTGKKLHVLFCPLLLTLFTLLCVLLILPKDSIFGSEGDWFSQHVAVAQQFRTIFQETGQILPDTSPLGAGSNIYDFSYYGLLRPDVLLSFALPQVPMTVIISVYAILELIAGANLCCYWLKKHLSRPFFSFMGGILYACAACFYHAHHQIMFVNYMPFLLLALLGIDRLLEKKKHGLLVLALVMVYLHSYYFAPAVLAVLLLYLIHCMYFMPGKSAHLSLWLRFFFSVGISIGIAAVLLLPTGLDLLSTKKDAGTAPAIQEILSLDFSMKSLLYHPYGCGLTILSLYTLLLSIKRKSTRLLSLALLLCLTVNTCSWLLSGMLYVRHKVLIPLIPLLILLCALSLERLFEREERHSLICGLLCFTPLLFSEYSPALVLDAGLTAGIFALLHLSCKAGAPQKVRLPLTLLLCLFPMTAFIAIGRQDKFISDTDTRQHVFSSEELEELNFDRQYRFDTLTEPYANVNVLSLTGMGKTTMYSSVTDSGYADFYYNTMRNPIRVRNRVALMSDANPMFSYLMGIRYIQAKSSRLPWGYSPIAEKEGIVIAENQHVLPTAYASTGTMAQTEYEKLEFPYSLEAMTRYTITDMESGNSTDSGTASGNSTAAEDFMQTSQITAVSKDSLDLPGLINLLEAQGVVCEWNQADCSLKLSLKTKTKAVIPLQKPLQNQMLICALNVTSPSGREVTIDFNGIRNKLSGKHAPYPNRNDTFTWMVSSNEEIRSLKLELSAGTYILSDIRLWIMDLSQWGNQNIWEVNASPEKGKSLFRGFASLQEQGWFVTSFPYRDGYQILLDGEHVPACRVNTEFVGIPLTAGTHEIVIAYQPPGKRISLIISLLSLVLFLVTPLFQRSIRHATVRNRIFSKRFFIIYQSLIQKRGDMMKKFLSSNKFYEQLQMMFQNNSFRELFSYLLTGGATTFVNYAVYLTLLHTNAEYLTANTIAWVFAVGFAYVTNRKFVFRSGNQIGKEMFSFVSMRFLTLITENLLLAFFIQSCQFRPVISKIAVSFVTVAANYVICKCHIFQKPASCVKASVSLPAIQQQKGEESHE